MRTCSGKQPPVTTTRKNQAVYIHPHQQRSAMKVTVAIVGSEFLLVVGRSAPTHLPTIHEDDPRGEPIGKALHLLHLRRTRIHNGTRHHKRVVMGKHAMRKLVANRRA